MMEAPQRPNGVQVPQGQLSPGQGTPRTVTNFAEVQTYGVEYVDDSGNKHVTLALRIGGTWHLAPNGENYAASLRALKGDTWLAKALEEKHGDALPATVPDKDAVDVLPGS
jgi:hypothetical protein